MPLGGPVAGSHEQAVQPRVELLGVAQAAQVEPGLEEGVLDCVGRLLVVAEDQAGRRIQPVGQAGRQRRERVDVPRPSPYHQVLLHLIAFVVTAIRPA